VPTQPQHLKYKKHQTTITEEKQMQAETYQYHGQATPLKWLAEIIATKTTAQTTVEEIINTVKQSCPKRAQQLEEFRNKVVTS
jgi:TATA-binding protein-associated factor Taf7